MFAINKPSIPAIQQFLQDQAGKKLTYTEVGATATAPPAQFAIDHTRTCLGHGEATFENAKQALRTWEQFRLGWVEPSSYDIPIETNQNVGVLARFSGVWSLNACRIVYTIDETAAVCRYGFAYGTLPAHVESGEERFQVEWHRQDDSVWYDIFAFSRPHHILTRLGYPLVRRFQKKFALDSTLAIQQAISRGKT